MTTDFKQCKFDEVPVKGYFRLKHDGPSFQKTSPTGYYQDVVLGEMQVYPETLVIPVTSAEDTPVVHV